MELAARGVGRVTGYTVPRTSPRTSLCSSSLPRVKHRAAGSRRYPGPFEDMGADILKAPKLILTDDERRRLDESPDANFYATPRMMQHADEAALEALTETFSHILPSNCGVLELCASAHSHLPAGVRPRLMVGQGMNSNEMKANPALHQHFLQDLNLQPLLLEQLDSSYDVVLCVNGIQYLAQPETVIAEASRVLRPGGILVVAFGPYCFREKAVAGWLSRIMPERTQLLQQIIGANGFDTPVVLDSPAAAAAAFGGTQHNPAATGAQSPLFQPQDSAAAAAFDNGGGSNSSSGAQLQVLVARKSRDWTAGAAAADAAAGVDMRPDNVQDWFTKPGLAGLTEAASRPTQQRLLPPQQTQQQPDQHTSNSSSSNAPLSNAQAATGAVFSSTGIRIPRAGNTGGTASKLGPTQGPGSTATGGTGSTNSVSWTGGAVNERLLEQWHAAYESLVIDAVDLGIPRSVIPSVKADASPAELQEAVQHLQDMMASFMSAGL